MSFKNNETHFSLSKIPCVRDCPNRNAECHSTCIAYQTWQIERKAFLNEKNKQKQIEYESFDRLKILDKKLRRNKK